MSAARFSKLPARFSRSVKLVCDESADEDRGLKWRPDEDMQRRLAAVDKFEKVAK